MKLIQKCIILLLILSTKVCAYETITVKKNDDIYKKLKLSFEVKENPNNKNLLSITVKIGTLKVNDHELSSLFLQTGIRYVKTKEGEKSRVWTGNETIKPAIINGTAVFNFEIKKDLIKNSMLDFCYHKNRKPLARYELYLKDYTK